jgi:hypothetical protein
MPKCGLGSNRLVVTHVEPRARGLEPGDAWCDLPYGNESELESWLNKHVERGEAVFRYIGRTFA